MPKSAKLVIEKSEANTDAKLISIYWLGVRKIE